MIIILRVFFVLLSIIISWFTFFNFSLKAAIISSLCAAVISLVLIILIEFVSHTFSTRNLVASFCGLFLGLLIAFFIIQAFSFFTSKMEVNLQMFVKLVVYHIFGFSVMMFFLIKNEDIGIFDKMLPRSIQGSGEIVYKILDTSVIIDGRIADICDTGFVEGVLVIPNFVLDELQMIADSADSIKRNRGRRGLDILNKMQKDQSIKVKISDMDFPDIHEVDAKLVKLGKIMNAKIVTNDFNLNKVAEFHGVTVLNINQLSNALKPIVLPGEEMHISLIKEGKDQNQAVGYLDDGTMIVVENGRKNLHEAVDVVVTSVLQTTAGRMIFARIKNEEG